MKRPVRGANALFSMLPIDFLESFAYCLLGLGSGIIQSGMASDAGFIDRKVPVIIVFPSRMAWIS